MAARLYPLCGLRVFPVFASRPHTQADFVLFWSGQCGIRVQMLALWCPLPAPPPGRLPPPCRLAAFSACPPGRLPLPFVQCVQSLHRSLRFVCHWCLLPLPPMPLSRSPACLPEWLPPPLLRVSIKRINLHVVAAKGCFSKCSMLSIFVQPAQ